GIPLAVVLPPPGPAGSGRPQAACPLPGLRECRCVSLRRAARVLLRRCPGARRPGGGRAPGGARRRRLSHPPGLRAPQAQSTPVMIQRPQFRPHFHVEVVEGEGVYLISEKGHNLVRGRRYELLAPWIDGRRTADEIAERLQD